MNPKKLSDNKCPKLDRWLTAFRGRRFAEGEPVFLGEDYEKMLDDWCVNEVVNFRVPWDGNLSEDRYMMNIWFFAQVCVNICKPHDSWFACEALLWTLCYLIMHCLLDDVSFPCELFWAPFKEYPKVSFFSDMTLEGLSVGHERNARL